MRLPRRRRRGYRPGRREALVGALLLVAVLAERLRGRGGRRRDDAVDEVTRESAQPREDEPVA